MSVPERAVIVALIDAVEAGAPFVTDRVLREVAANFGGSPGANTYAVDRLLRRGLLTSQWKDGTRIGYLPTRKAYLELQRESSN